jgi:chaperonin GroEL (HSP60 family)
MAARAIADAVRSTLGLAEWIRCWSTPWARHITNDGVTILKEIDVEHPAAKMLVEVAKTQDEECGDGTTTAVVLTGELLKKSIDLIDANVHPTIITAGYRMAANKAMEVLESVGVKVEPKDRETLMKIAKTAMMSKSVSGSKELMAQVAVDSVSNVAEKVDGKWQVDMDNIQVTKKHGGSMDDTQLIPGIIIDKEPVHPGMPKRTISQYALWIRLRSKDEIEQEEIRPQPVNAFIDEDDAC